MNKFKVGDKVRCVSGYHSYICVGETYTVSKVEKCNLILKDKEHPYHYSYFEPVKPEFDMKRNPWFIRVNNKEEFDLVADFLEAKGFSFYEKQYIASTKAIGNTDLACNIERDSRVSRLMTSEIENVIHHGAKEIKINFKKSISIDNIDYPDVKSAQDVEIEKIETEMRKLADRLNKLKG